MKKRNERNKKTKKGISLIVLVITIIVMIILAAAVIISLSNSGIIGKANEAVEKSNLKQVQIVAQTIWVESQLTKDDPTTIKNKIIAAIGGETVASKYDIDVDENGVTVNIKNEVSNGPTLTITTPASKDINNPTTVNTATYTVSGTVLGDTGIKDVIVKYPGEGINMETVIAWQDIGQDGSWSTTINLIKDEVMPITIVATDVKDNTRTEVRYVRYIDVSDDGNNSDGSQYYLYSGYAFPQFPEWDKETYPYVILCHGSGFGNGVLYFSNAKPKQLIDSGISTVRMEISEDDLQCISYISSFETNSWDVMNEYESGNVNIIASCIIWSNTEIPSEDGTVFFEKSSEPILTNASMDFDPENIEGKVIVNDRLVKISEVIPNIEDLETSSIVLSSYSIPFSQKQQAVDGLEMFIYETPILGDAQWALIVVTKPCEADGVVFNETGIYTPIPDEHFKLYYTSTLN